MAEKTSQRLILASGSLGRRLLMEDAGYSFDVRPANIDEPDGRDARDPREFVHHVAWLKAAAAALRYDDGLVIAADTVGWIEGEVIGKPTDEADARRILNKLGGATHELWTGVVLWRRPDDVQLVWQEVSRVAFRKLSDAEIDTYLATRKWQGCSGAYAVNMEHDDIVTIVEGSVSNVVGLPMETLARVLPLLSK